MSTMLIETSQTDTQQDDAPAKICSDKMANVRAKRQPKNRFTQLRGDLLKTYKKLGGQKDFYHWVISDKSGKNKEKFYSWLIDMIPKQSEVQVSGQIEHEHINHSIDNFLEFALAIKALREVKPAQVLSIETDSNIVCVDNIDKPLISNE